MRERKEGRGGEEHPPTNWGSGRNGRGRGGAKAGLVSQKEKETVAEVEGEGRVGAWEGNGRGGKSEDGTRAGGTKGKDGPPIEPNLHIIRHFLANYEPFSV